MRLFALTALSLATLPACIILDADCVGPECSPFDDDLLDDDDGDPDDDDGAGGDTPDIPALTLEFFPATAEAGEVFLASIVVSEGQADLREAMGLRLYGDVELLVWGARQHELTATVAVPADALPAEVDVVVEFADGTAELLPAALTLFPAGSGNGADDWSGGGPTGGPTGGECE